MPESGSVSWPADNPVWRFNWRLADHPTGEGVAITNASYRGHKVFHKASLPLIRVQYYPSGSHGPYKDPLNWNNARPTVRCPSNRVCVYSYSRGGVPRICVESYHTGSPGLGSYHLTERWIFTHRGEIYPQFYSAGIQHCADHHHHPYWRFDFDIDDPSDDQAWEFNNVGQGNQWTYFREETARRKNPSTRRSWAVMDKNSRRGYHILPGSNDGTANSFSNSDIWFTRYKFDEDQSGAIGTSHNDGLHQLISPRENIDNQDIAIWYSAHLFHHVERNNCQEGRAPRRGTPPEGTPDNEWHHAGPVLIPFGNWA